MCAILIAVPMKILKYNSLVFIVKNNNNNNNSIILSHKIFQK